MSHRSDKCQTKFKKINHKGDRCTCTYICGEFRECDACMKKRVEAETKALTDFFTRNLRKPILVKTFSGPGSGDRATKFIARLRRAVEEKSDALYRRYALEEETVIVLHIYPLDTTAEDLTMVDLKKRIPEWVKQPKGKNLSGKLGDHPPKRKKHGDLVYTWSYQSDAPDMVKDRLEMEAVERTKKMPCSTVNERREKVLTIERYVRTESDRLGYSIGFSVFNKEYITENPNIPAVSKTFFRLRQRPLVPIFA